MLRTCFFTALCQLFLAALALAQAPPAPVRVSRVGFEQIQARRRVTGEIRSHRRAQIAAREAGWVIEVLVFEGQTVEEGDLLARVDARKLILERDQAVAEGLRAMEIAEERKVILEQARADLEALTALSERGATNPKELRDAGFDLRVAQAREKQATHQLAGLRARADLLSTRIEDTEIRAPWSGRVIARYTEAGQWLDVGAEVVELLSMTQLEAWLLVPQRYFGVLEVEETALELSIDATDATLYSQAVRSVPLVDARGRTFRVIATLAADPQLAPGMSVTAWIPTGESARSLLVPRSAILRNEAGPYVYLAVPGAEGQPGTAMLTPITIKFSVGDRAVVESRALNSESLVVTEGNERLFPMAPILATPEGNGAQAGESGR